MPKAKTRRQTAVTYSAVRKAPTLSFADFDARLANAERLASQDVQRARAYSDALTTVTVQGIGVLPM